MFLHKGIALCEEAEGNYPTMIKKKDILKQKQGKIEKGCWCPHVTIFTSKPAGPHCLINLTK